MLLRFTLSAVFVFLGLGSLFADDFRPTAVCVSQLNVAVDADCVGTISTAMIDAGSSSSWGPLYLSLSQTEFYPGSYVVTMTAQDALGSNSCFTQITVEDKTPPELSCEGSLTI